MRKAVKTLVEDSDWLTLEKYFEENIEALDETFNLIPEFRSNTIFLQCMASSYIHIGLKKYSLELVAEAKVAFEKALILAKQEGKTSRSEPKIFWCSNNLSSCYHKLGFKHYATGDYAQALANFNEAIDQINETAKFLPTFTNDIKISRNLSTFYNLIGMCHEALANNVLAMESYHRAIVALETYLMTTPLALLDTDFNIMLSSPMTNFKTIAEKCDPKEIIAFFLEQLRFYESKLRETQDNIFPLCSVYMNFLACYKFIAVHDLVGVRKIARQALACLVNLENKKERIYYHISRCLYLLGEIAPPDETPFYLEAVRWLSMYNEKNFEYYKIGVAISVFCQDLKGLGLDYVNLLCDFNHIFNMIVREFPVKTHQPKNIDIFLETNPQFIFTLKQIATELSSAVATLFELDKKGEFANTTVAVISSLLYLKGNNINKAQQLARHLKVNQQLQERLTQLDDGMSRRKIESSQSASSAITESMELARNNKRPHEDDDEDKNQNRAIKSKMG